MEFKEFIQTVKDGAEDAVDITKQKAKISKEKSKIKKNYEEIGKYYYKKYVDTSEADEEVIQYINEISESRKIMAECNDEIERIKNVK